MRTAYICDGVRTPIGKYAGALSSVRADDLAAVPLKALMARNPGVDWAAVDDVILGCANQAGEDNRNVARMALLLAGMPVEVPGVTLNRLCGSGLDAVAQAARGVVCGALDLAVAGGVESMSRAPYVVSKAEAAYGRGQRMYDTSMGWRLVNPALEAAYGADPMPRTAETVAERHGVLREHQDMFAKQSQERAEAAIASGRLAREIVPVDVPQRKGDPVRVDTDEHPRNSSLDVLGRLKPLYGESGTVTAGNASGVNDGAAAVIVASEDAVARHGLTPRARWLGGAVAGVEPAVMGMGPVPASRKVLARLGMGVSDMDVVEINEAFASQSLAVLRELGLPDDADWVNPNGGAIALGHPLGMSGTRIALSAVEELHVRGADHALAAMCIGVGQGIASVLARV